jgi:hypothetical protein
MIDAKFAQDSKLGSENLNSIPGNQTQVQRTWIGIIPSNLANQSNASHLSEYAMITSLVQWSK